MKISVLDGATFDLESMGAKMVIAARYLALLDGASKNAKDTWNTLSTGLELGGGEPGPSELERIGKAWKSYLAMGKAPSVAWVRQFRTFARDCKLAGYDFKRDKPPAEVIAVFDRMLGGA